jgi:cell division transport system permease protein
MPRSLRPAGADDLGLKRALSDRLLPLLVAAMTFLAALALAGAIAAEGLAAHWRTGAASILTVQVPAPDDPSGQGTRADQIQRLLVRAPGVTASRRLSAAEISALLQPWLGQDPKTLSLTLPAMFEVRIAAPAMDTAPLASQLEQAAPGTLVEQNGAWLTRLADLVRSLRACAALALLVVAFVAASVIAVSTRAGLAARRDAIEIVHGLGATDGMIAGQFAGRITALAIAGALLGVVLAVPVLLGLANLATPFGAAGPAPVQGADLLRALPPDLWASLAALPPLAAAIGWITAQATVRGWLGRLA